MRAILLILDGVGVGDSDLPSESECNTLASVIEATGCRMSTLERLGIANLLGPPTPHAEATASYGKATLAYAGADSYLGHQEILGVIPPVPTNQLLEVTSDRICAALVAAGSQVEMLDGGPALLVDDDVLVGDNLEAAPGQAVNLIGATTDMAFQRLEEIGHLVRAEVLNSRVIVCGGRSFGVDDLRANLTRAATGQHGVATPSIGLYDNSFQVRHIGLPVDSDSQIHTRLMRNAIHVSLLGKVADLAAGDVSERDPTVATSDILDRLEDWQARHKEGFVAATVQETDLAGHEQDPVRFASVLETVDARLRGILECMDQKDLLVVTADHGNDPVNGGGRHSREKVPVLSYRPGTLATDLGQRSTLADVAASIADHFDIRWGGDGISFSHDSVKLPAP